MDNQKEMFIYFSQLIDKPVFDKNGQWMGKLYDIIVKSTEINSKGYHPVRLNDEAQCTRCDICGMICPDFAICVVDIGEQQEIRGQS